jgi:non-heme chloroperoxidase
MGTITTSDGTEIFFKDWGSGPPIVFSHGWPLSADDWDTQLMFFLLEGYRVVAHDRRGHGRSTQTDGGHDMDHYADDLAAVVAHLDLRDAVHVGHSTGGGEVVRYLARHGEDRVAKAVLISSVPPLMEPRRTAQERVRRLPELGRHRPLGVLPRPGLRPVLRVQSSGREVF